MPPMFWRFVKSPWVAILSLCLGILGIPSMPEDAATWSSWFANMPLVLSLALLSLGFLLLARYIVASRERIRDFTLKLLGAASAGQAAFRKHFRPPIRKALWSDFDSGQPPVEINRWEILEHTIRSTGMVDGEAYPALVGMARVKEFNGQHNLYMCKFVHAGTSHTELRIESHHDPVTRRRALVRVDREVLSDMTFQPCLTAAVFDTRNTEDISQETAQLLDVGEAMIISVTDTVPDRSGGQREYRHDLLRVPLLGYSDVEARLSGVARSIWSASVLSYSPPALVPALDPRLIDQSMKLISDPTSYAAWRKRMAEQFHTEDHDSQSVDETE